VTEIAANGRSVEKGREEEKARVAYSIGMGREGGGGGTEAKEGISIIEGG